MLIIDKGLKRKTTHYGRFVRLFGRTDVNLFGLGYLAPPEQPNNSWLIIDKDLKRYSPPSFDHGGGS